MELRKAPKANLENKRIVFLEIGFIVALLIVFAAFEYRTYEIDTFVLPPDSTPFEMEEMAEITKQEPEIPKPPPNLTVLNLVSDDRTDIDDDIPLDVSVEIDQAVEEYTYVPDPPEDIPDDIPFVTIAEEPAMFPGGMIAFYEFLKANIKYPRMAVEQFITGTVYVEFIVEEDGQITEVILKRGIGGGCDEEAMRVVSMMPSWTPAKQQKRPVRYKMILPIKFSLN